MPGGKAGSRNRTGKMREGNGIFVAQRLLLFAMDNGKAPQGTIIRWLLLAGGFMVHRGLLEWGT